MHLRCATFLALLLLSANCCGQSARRAEIYGGYSFAVNDFTGGMLYNSDTTLSRGWDVSLNLRLNHISQLVADFGGYYLPGQFCDSGATSCSSIVNTLMFGPQLSFRPPRSKFTPFVHPLFGVALASQTGLPPSLVSNHSLIMALGGGVDRRLTRRFGLRGQADYLRTRFTNGDDQVPFQNNNLRLSAGLIVRF